MKIQNFKLKTQSHNSKLKSFTIYVAVLNFALYALTLSLALAQDISLSITPPIFEVMIQPGKEISQRYLLTNSGNETIIKAELVPFTPEGEFGNVRTLDDLSLYESIEISDWITLVSPQIQFGGKFLLPRGSDQEIMLRIAPPTNVPEGEYYLTLLFETDSEGLIGSQTPSANAKIATNILLTISKDGNPRKDAVIEEFKAPLIIDSFSKIIYTVRIKNTGSTLFKPQGYIVVKPFFGDESEIKLAPLNILSSSIRQIPCIKDEQLIRCTYGEKALIGIYRSSLKFKADENGNSYEESIITIAFPFTISLALIVVFIIFKIIKRLTTRSTIR